MARQTLLCCVLALGVAATAPTAAGSGVDDFFALLDGQNQLLAGGGTGWNGGEWIEYDQTGWWNQWFYDDPPSRERYKAFYWDMDILPMGQPGPETIVEVALNWSNLDYPATGPGGAPPMPWEEPFIERQVIYSGPGVVPGTPDMPLHLRGSYLLREYNPEWVSIDIRVQSGFITEEQYEFVGRLGHWCLPKPIPRRPVYSLDDNPADPLTTTPAGPIPGYGAENPYGNPAWPGPAPSPSLVVPPAMDGDLLQPAGPVPAMHVSMSPMYGKPVSYLDGVSNNADACQSKVEMLHLAFSVDRASQGHPLTDVRAQADANQQPGDVFMSRLTLVHPERYVCWQSPVQGYGGPLPHVSAAGGGNRLLFDESRLGLTAGMGPGNPIGPDEEAPPIERGTHDNVDAFELRSLNANVDNDLTQDVWTYFTINPDQALLAGAFPASEANIYDVAPNAAPMIGVPWAHAWQMGLMGDGPAGERDCIDALVVWDRAAIGSEQWNGPGAEACIDYALFSLAPGSVSLRQHQLSAADIFFTDFQGTFWLYATADELGLLPGDPFEWPYDNVDALEVVAPGDANLDGLVSDADYTIWADNYGVCNAAWQMGDFNGDGCVTDADYTIWADNYGTCAGEVPEPCTALLLCLGLFAARRRR